MPISETADLVLFYAPQSRASTAVCFLEELDEPYRLEVIDLHQGDQKKPEFLKHNPMGKVPVILDGDVAVAESGAIFTYLADKYAAGRLAPLPHEPERGDFLRWMFFVSGVMEPAYAQKFFKWEVPERQAGWGSFDSMLQILDRTVSEREWLTGQFSAADTYAASFLRYGMMFGVIPKDGALAQYVGRWAARPAVERAGEIEARYVPQEH